VREKGIVCVFIIDRPCVCFNVCIFTKQLSVNYSFSVEKKLPQSFASLIISKRKEKYSFQKKQKFIFKTSSINHSEKLVEH